MAIGESFTEPRKLAPIDDALPLIRERLITGFKWSALAELASRTVQPLVSIVLARILVPSDYGIVAAASVVISLGQVVQEFGLSKALIQTDQDHEEYANNAFWLSLIVSSVLCAVIVAFAPTWCAALGVPASAGILRALSLQLVISSLTVVHSALFQRNAQFKHLFAVRAIASLAPAATSIWLATRGWGAWALVIGSLSSSGAQAIVYWTLSPWRPAWRLDWRVVRRMVRFSRWVALEGVASWMILWGDVVVLAYFMTTDDVGRYRLGTMFIIFVSNVFFTPVVPVTYSLFSRLQNDPYALQMYYLKLSKLVAAVILPLGLVCALLAAPLVRLVFGPQWVGADVVIAAMAVRWATGCVVGLNSSTFTAIGRPDLNVKLLLAVTAITIPVYMLSAPYGLAVFCIARVAAAQVDHLLSYLVVVRALRLPPQYLLDNLRNIMVALAFAGVVCLALTVWEPVAGMVQLFVTGAVTLTVYAGALGFLEPRFARWAVRSAARVAA